jgi:Lrp/AsnC family transcriptional regulator, leucine-responsive regulatory protein
MKRLEERGIISGYGARINPAAVGLPMTAIVRLRTTHEHIKACLELFGTMHNVIEVFRLTGEDCFFLKVLVPRPEDLEPIVDSIARYGAVTTSLVLRQESPKPISRNLIPRP